MLITRFSDLSDRSGQYFRERSAANSWFSNHLQLSLSLHFFGRLEDFTRGACVFRSRLLVATLKNA
jgi:hypothetical protein